MNSETPANFNPDDVPKPDPRDGEIHLLKVQITNLQNELETETKRASRTNTLLSTANEKLRDSVGKSLAVMVGVAFLIVGIFLGWVIHPSQENEVAALSKDKESLVKELDTAKKDHKACLLDPKKAGAFIETPVIPPVDFSPVLNKIDEKCGPMVTQVVPTKPSQKKQWKGGASTQPSSHKPPTVVSGSGEYLLWHHHDATPSNPKMCIISGGDGKGLPPYCSAFTLQEGKVGETKNEWLLRVGGGKDPTDTGVYTKKD